MDDSGQRKRRGAMTDVLGGFFGPRGLGASARAEALAEAERRHGLQVLSRLPAEALKRECGLTTLQARRLEQAFALGRAVERSATAPRPLIAAPIDVARHLAPEIRGLEVETFHVLVLDARHRLKARTEISRGTLTSAPVHPREVFGPALRMAAAAVVVAHNHPSGDPCPSADDLAVTRRLAEAGRLLGVPLLDHVVVAVESWISMRERVDWPDRTGRRDRWPVSSVARRPRAG